MKEVYKIILPLNLLFYKFSFSLFVKINLATNKLTYYFSLSFNNFKLSNREHIGENTFTLCTMGFHTKFDIDSFLHLFIIGL